MKKRFGTFVLFFFVFSTMMTLFPSYGAACSCAQPPGVKEELSQSKAVFSGKVMEIEEKKSVTGFTTKSALFEVKEAWKGVSQSQIKVTTGAGGGDCGYDFKAGQSYLVYANGSDMYGSNKLTVILCSRTAEISAAQDDLAILGEGQVPGEKVDLQKAGANNVVIVLTSVAVAALFIWLYLKKRHKSN